MSGGPTTYSVGPNQIDPSIYSSRFSSCLCVCVWRQWLVPSNYCRGHSPVATSCRCYCIVEPCVLSRWGTVSCSLLQELQDAASPLPPSTSSSFSTASFWAVPSLNWFSSYIMINYLVQSSSRPRCFHSSHRRSHQCKCDSTAKGCNWRFGESDQTHLVAAAKK